MRKVEVFSTADELYAQAAQDLTDALLATLERKEQAHLALTGGSGGSGVLGALASPQLASSVPWHRVHVWWSDERWLPEGDPERNCVQARGACLDGLAIPEANIHPMGASDDGLSLDDAAAAYGAGLKAFALDGGPAPEFDVLLLGVGPDGHIASLFPSFPQVTEDTRPVVAVRNSPKPPPERLSLTLPVINRAARVWFVVRGEDKAAAVRLALANVAPIELPAAGAHGREQTVWYLDGAAAHDLDLGALATAN